MYSLIIFCVAVIASSSEARSSGLYELNILHYNDFHARFVETSPAGWNCNPAVAPCIGGFARLATSIRQGLARDPHSLVLNAGDSFQGTIWYNLLRWSVTQEFMNLVPHDAHVLGNHEFDNGISGVVPYLKFLEAPVVTVNIIDDDEPSIQGLYKPSVVVEKNGRRIGIIGVLLASTNVIASTGHLRFANEVETVKAEAEKLNAEGVDIIVVLSHCGLDVDRDIALNAGPHIDIIVGGHSHSLLYNEVPPESTTFVPVGPYPVVVKQEERSVLIVQAAAHTEYLGEIKLYFDDAGNLLDWNGHPHYLGNEVEQAQDVLEKIDKYLPVIEELANVEIGTSLVDLSSDCFCQECNLGNLICNAYMNQAKESAQEGQWNSAHFCVINRGAIRASIDAGDFLRTLIYVISGFKPPEELIGFKNLVHKYAVSTSTEHYVATVTRAPFNKVITYETVVVAQPFENNVEVFELRGDHVMEMLEYGVANDPWPGARMLQFSGLRIVVEGARPIGSRVVNATVQCIECDQPVYEPLDLNKYYKVAAQSFLGEGGDDFTMVSENRRNVEVIGVDYDILIKHIEQQTPIDIQVDGRIQITDACIRNE